MAYGRGAAATPSLIYEGTGDGNANTHTLPSGLVEYDVEYEWQMSYDWEYKNAAGETVVKNATNWSEPEKFTLERSVKSNVSGWSSDDGCDTGVGTFALILAVLPLVIRRRGV
jgi:Synergist-CTERM protein sorting domain-containing protein